MYVCPAYLFFLLKVSASMDTFFNFFSTAKIIVDLYGFLLYYNTMNFILFVS